MVMRLGNHGFSLFILSILLIQSSTSVCFAGDFVSVSGRLGLLGVVALDGDSIKEDPSITGRLKIDTAPTTLSFHTWLEGGWDGSVKRPVRDHSLLKSWDEVYQRNTPFLEFKELYAGYSTDSLELRAGIQRFAWGRLDEYPINDLLNPWDYSQFLRKSLEDRKIGVPSLSASFSKGDWSCDAVWVPLFVPYRLPQPNERWFGASALSGFAQLPGAEIVPNEPDMPPRTLENSTIALRVRRTGDIEWALSLFHGFDPRPVFKTTALAITPLADKIRIDPGFVPDFRKITVIGLDAATVTGDWSLRAELAYTFGRVFNIRQDLWGYPPIPTPGIYSLQPIGQVRDTFDYGIGADYRLFEEGLLTMQAQQTVIFDRPDTMYEQTVETLLWVNLKAGWMNRKLETDFNIACNPEHGDVMAKAEAWYIFSDSWKAGLTAISFSGPGRSLFGRFSMNDQLEAVLIYSW
jgi:hypothetical protein